jgi:DNA-binding response OmpR family regulator
MRGKTILIVDDEEQWLRILARLFRERGYEVLSAGSCAAALALLRTSRVDCAIVDFNLGDADGSLVCAAIRERDKEIKKPVIMITGDPEAARCMCGSNRPDMLVFKDQPISVLPPLMASLF